MKSSIEINNVSYSYRTGHEVLSGLSADIPAGKLTSVIGRNGCGKTTLLKIISGVIPFRKGHITRGGIDMAAIDSRRRACLFASVFFSDFALSAFNVSDFILLGRFPVKKTYSYSKKDYQLVHEAAEQCRISGLLNKKMNGLSSGELQLVLLAGALCRDVPVVVLDEPVSHLDVNHALNIFSILRHTADSGKTVILSVHDINAALTYSDNIIALSGGTAVYSGSPSGFTAGGTAEKTFGVAFDEIRDGSSGKHYILPARSI